LNLKEEKENALIDKKAQRRKERSKGIN